MDTKLKTYPGFIEGGVRLQLEDGRPTTMAEITISVFKHLEESDVRHFYFNADILAKEAIQIICKDFAGQDGSRDIRPENHTLYRADIYNEASFPVRRMNVNFKQNNVHSGDLLILQATKDCDPTE